MPPSKEQTPNRLGSIKQDPLNRESPPVKIFKKKRGKNRENGLK